MPTPRTATTRWKHLRRQALRLAQERGITHCPDCNVPLNYEIGKQPNSAEPDHIIPASRGGEDSLENLRICCRQCNQARGNKPLGRAQTTRRTTTTLAVW